MDVRTERLAQFEEVAESIGYPVIVKPSGGGGGIGMAVARDSEELVKAVHSVEEKGSESSVCLHFTLKSFSLG